MDIKINSFNQDYSTNDVLDWVYFENDSIACSRSDKFEIEDMYITNQNNISKNESYWFRRGFLKEEGYNPFPLLNQCENKQVKKIFLEIHKKYSYEERAINESYIYWYDKLFKNSLNKLSDNNVNKLKVLQIAKATGLLIPETIITSNISTIESFYNSKEKIIVKDVMLDEIKMQWEDIFDIRIKVLPKIVTESHLEQLRKIKKNISQGYIFIQEYINKKYELRIFYLNGKFYSMAIFSQSNERTKVDFRNYDDERPNRCVPYQLPKKECKKLHVLMSKLNINCGSIDMIYSTQNKYVFLEVNPIGQFQWLSKNCNYDIERSIARFLNDELV
ncbi:hypothetical protein [Chryseobacterium scophthalmum]|uniref:hypothetical protein n=1 Tax=Chryseobacterium scophthalmum TaxID=59733 RepID=UPI003D044154